jgi:3'-phosphoadenosine 5'-phosphosulfate sulfotransferase (PAPS reductase)/FAD synthetase
VQAYLERPIVFLRADGETLIDRIRARGGFLPSPRMRWCTRELKIQPFERYVGDDYAYVYIALRADEAGRKGYVSRRSTLVPKYPFIEAGITHDDVLRILETSGLGLPSYYRWRSRSGCYCCFFQQRIEWIGLLENHPELYWNAAALEKVDEATGERYTWAPGTSLAELARPESIEQVRRQHEERTKLIEVRQAALARRPTCDEDGTVGCTFCDL